MYPFIEGRLKMKGSDKVDITINIVGELIKLNVDFDEQNSVRDTEKAIKIYADQLRKAWPENSDKSILAMVAYQFAKSYHQIVRQQEAATEIINQKASLIDENIKQNIL